MLKNNSSCFIEIRICRIEPNWSTRPELYYNKTKLLTLNLPSRQHDLPSGENNTSPTPRKNLCLLNELLGWQKPSWRWNATGRRVIITFALNFR